MAIFGTDFYWKEEIKKIFFDCDGFVIGQENDDINEIFNVCSLLKAGDIIYLKENLNGSRKLIVKGIGVVTKSFISSLIPKDTIKNWSNFYIPVKWIVKNKFQIILSDVEYSLIPVRTTTFYEEFLPYIQNEIIENIFSKKI